MSASGAAIFWSSSGYDPQVNESVKRTVKRIGKAAHAVRTPMSPIRPSCYHQQIAVDHLIFSLTSNSKLKSPPGQPSPEGSCVGSPIVRDVILKVCALGYFASGNCQGQDKDEIAEDCSHRTHALNGRACQPCLSRVVLVRPLGALRAGQTGKERVRPGALPEYPPSAGSVYMRTCPSKR